MTGYLQIPLWQVSRTDVIIILRTATRQDKSEKLNREFIAPVPIGPTKRGSILIEHDRYDGGRLAHADHRGDACLVAVAHYQLWRMS